MKNIIVTLAEFLVIKSLFIKNKQWFDFKVCNGMVLVTAKSNFLEEIGF
jgi:hypothetical protein